MLDIDAIERVNSEMMKTDYGDSYAPRWLHRQVVELVAELRKCRAAMDEVHDLIDDAIGDVMMAARDKLVEALRGAK